MRLGSSVVHVPVSFILTTDNLRSTSTGCFFFFFTLCHYLLVYFSDMQRSLLDSFFLDIV